MENPTTPNLVQEPMNPIPTPIEEPKNKYVLIILSIILIVLVGVVAFLGYQNYQLQKQINLLTTIPLPSPTPVATIDSTADWKGYSGAFGKYKYTFKYPNDLISLVTENGVISFFKNQNDLATCKREGQQNNSCLKTSFFVSLTAYTKQEFEESGIKNQAVVDPKNFTDKSGRVWKTDMILGETFNFNGTVEEGNNIYIIGIQSGLGDNWDTNNGQYFRNLANQILSTFKFIDATSSSSPTPAGKACTMEAKLCPNGSYVGRSGPNCEFSLCP